MKTLYQVERDYILSVLHMCHGNIKKTSEVLDIGRHTLYLKLKQYKESEKFFSENQNEIRLRLKSLVEKKTE